MSKFFGVEVAVTKSLVPDRGFKVRGCGPVKKKKYQMGQYRLGFHVIDVMSLTRKELNMNKTSKIIGKGIAPIVAAAFLAAPSAKAGTAGDIVAGIVGVAAVVTAAAIVADATPAPPPPPHYAPPPPPHRPAPPHHVHRPAPAPAHRQAPAPAHHAPARHSAPAPARRR